MSEQKLIMVVQELPPILLQGTPQPENKNAVKLVLKTRSDGTLKTYSIQVGRDSTGRDSTFLVEDDGTVRDQLVLWDGTDPVRWQAESAGGEAKMMLYGDDGSSPIALAAAATGELEASLKGENPSNALVGLLTDAQRMMRGRGFEPWRWGVPTTLSGGAGYQTAVTAPSSTGVVIEFTLSATSGTPSVDIHIVPDSGSPGTGNAPTIGATPVIGTFPPYRDGPYTLEPGAMLQARNTVGGTTACIIPWVEYYSTGDTV